MGVAETREELNKLSSVVLTARRLLCSGTMVDLSAIEERVSQVTETIATLPREEARPLRDDLIALINRLDMLGSDLREQLQQVSALVGGGPAR